METTFGIIAGSIFFVIGIVVFFTRKSLTKFSAEAQKATFGKAGEKVAAHANSGFTGTLGIFFALAGAALVVIMLTGVEI